VREGRVAKTGGSDYFENDPPFRQTQFAINERRQIMLSTNDDILRAAEDWRKSGRDVALATVVETWGSAPRPVGSNLVIDAEGNFLGSVSGGCVEGAVVTEALDVIESGRPKMLEFGVADETAWKVGLSCGGTIRVFVEKVE
jgi:xanthine/CO dehydrogenase XdhC/CoxF family maturation factor